MINSFNEAYIGTNSGQLKDNAFFIIWRGFLWADT